MQKIYKVLPGILLLAAFNWIQAQELIFDGDMEFEDSWIIVDLAPGDGHTETFGYTDDTPKDGEGGCLSLAGNGNWSNVAVCQEILVEKGVEYMISMDVKTSLDLAPQAIWVEIVVVPDMPVVDDPDIMAYPIRFSLNSWNCEEVTSVDGPFTENNCAAKSPLKDTIFYEGTGDTTVVLVLKVGGASPYNILLDNVSVLGPDNVGVEDLPDGRSVNQVYPNPASDRVFIRNTEAREIMIFDIVGKRVYSTTDIERNMSIDISQFAEGLYVIRAGSHARTFIKR